MTQFHKYMLVKNYLLSLGMNILTIAGAVDDSKLEESYRLIKENPKITKEEFIAITGIEEREY